MIRSINWIITGACNGRCVHCDMWRARDRAADLSLKDIARILADQEIARGYAKYGRKYDISFAGGEPFLRDDLQKIVDLVEKTYPGSFKCVTTNGLLGDRVVAFVRKNYRLGFKLNVSIDGLAAVNDTLRGKGAFRKALQTVSRIRKHFPGQAVEIKLTLSQHNYDQILAVYALATRLGCAFSFKPAEDLRHFTNSLKPLDTSLTLEQVCVVRNQCFLLADRMRRTGDDRRAAFYKDVPFYLAGKKKPSTCSVLNECLTIMPDGQAFFCVKEPRVGELPRERMADLKKVRNTASFKCKSCMLLCGAYKDYTPGPVRRTTANIETINRCNLDCDICTQRGVRAERRAEMSPAVFRKLIARHPEIAHASFIGGEPFLNKDFLAMMDHLDRQAITYEITTNGTLVSKAVAERLKDCIGLKSVLFSLDGLETYHDKERGRGTFKKCLQAVCALKEFVAVGVCSVVKADNGGDLVGLAAMLGELGVRDHRIIYGMSLSPEVRKRTLALVPGLTLQGPYFDGQTGDYRSMLRLFGSLEEVSRRTGIKHSYVPGVFRSRTKDFLAGKLTQAGYVECRQLEQLRFNAGGKRIVCEFIRDVHSPGKVRLLKDRLPPLCEQCCKLTEHNIEKAPEKG